LLRNHVLAHILRVNEAVPTRDEQTGHVVTSHCSDVVQVLLPLTDRHKARAVSTMRPTHEKKPPWGWLPRSRTLLKRKATMGLVPSLTYHCVCKRLYSSCPCDATDRALVLHQCLPTRCSAAVSGLGVDVVLQQTRDWFSRARCLRNVVRVESKFAANCTTPHALTFAITQKKKWG
jgi:hypothetical protein